VSITQPASPDQQLLDLEARLEAVERDVVTLTAALDAASRLRISSLLINPDLRIAGGKRVRRILERGGLVEGYPEVPTAS
jgi:hypothetical protein